MHESWNGKREKIELYTCKHKRTRDDKIRKPSFLPHAFSIRRSFASLVFCTLSCLASSTARFNSNACHVSSLPRPSILLLGTLGVNRKDVLCNRASEWGMEWKKCSSVKPLDRLTITCYSWKRIKWSMFRNVSYGVDVKYSYNDKK